MVKVAIIGAGFMGEIHAKCFEKIKNAEIMAIVDRAEEKAKNLASQFNINYYTSIEDMLERENVDAVDICTIPYQHANMGITAANAGKHVLSEKPFALSLNDSDKLIKAVEKNKVKAMTGFVLRFWPEYVKAKEIIDSKELGNPVYAFSQRLIVMPDWMEDKWTSNEKYSAGVFDLIIHDFDFLIWFFGIPKTLKSQGVFNKKYGGFMNFNTFADFDNKVSGTSEGGWGYFGNFPFTMVFRIICEKGAIEWMFRAGKNVEKRSVASPLVIYNPDGSIFSHEYVQTDPFLSECSYFVDCIENGSEITKGSLQDDRNALLYSLSAKRSYELNKAVKFGQI